MDSKNYSAAEKGSKSSTDTSLIDHMRENFEWWLVCLVTMVIVVTSEMIMLGKIVWVVILFLMAYYVPKIDAYLQRKMQAS